MSDLSHIEWEATEIKCRYCGDSLRFTDEVYVLSDSTCVLTEEGVTYNPTEEDMEFRNAPCFFCFDCWEECEENIRLLKEDEPPVADDYAVLECDICESGIRDGEVLGTAVFGEVHLSKRVPHGERATTIFESMDPNPTVVCVGCLYTMHRDVVEVWDQALSQGGECDDGTVMRCWRYGCGPGTCKKMRETG
jgi:hypothetical protein